MLATAAALLFLKTAHASSSHRESELAYLRAENIHHHLEAKPFTSRTRQEYEHALDAYRAVYHGDPASPDAARSIAVVADLLTSEGRCFHDTKLFRDAVGQWEFLRQQYPGSPLRQQALFQEARIEQNDLQDRVAARKLYRTFLRRYPHGSLAEQARANLVSRVEAKESSSFQRTSTTHSGSFVNAAQGKSSAVRRSLTRYSVPTTSPQPSAFPRSFTPENRSVSLPRMTQPTPSSPATIQAVRYWTEGDATRLAVDMNRPVPYHAYVAPDGKQITLVFFGAHPSGYFINHPIPVAHDANLRSIRATILTATQAELVLELSHAASFSSFALSNPYRLILDVRAAYPKNSAPAIAKASLSSPSEFPLGHHARAQRADSNQTIARSFSEAALPSEPALSAQPTADGQRSMARVLGLRVRRIVIDAGHGGHDSGTLGAGGLEEKDVTLDVALRLGHLLHQRLGADVIYTRRTDKFVPLEERTAIANHAHADLFLSIHANSSSDPDVRGVETYFLNFTSSPDALQVAARENAISNRSVHELSDLVRKIALSDKIDESREFAADVQQSLYDGITSGNPGIKNRGVKQAPFVVLIGANMPSILAEISFLTNPEDASELAHPAYRERLAESLYRGVAEYVDGMSGIRVAKTGPPETLRTPTE